MTCMGGPPPTPFCYIHHQPLSDWCPRIVFHKVDCAFVPPFLALRGKASFVIPRVFILRTPLYLMPSMANPNERRETLRREPQLVSSGTCRGVRPLSVFSNPCL